MVNIGARRSSRLRPLAKSFLVYASYWYMIGPACALSLQLYLNHRFGLVNLLGNATFPDIICVFSCIVLLCYLVISLFARLSTRRIGFSVAAGVCGALALFGTEVPVAFGLPVSAWTVASMFLFSFFFMTQLLIWFEVFACHDNMLNLIYILLVTALAGFLCWFLIGLVGARLICALVVTVLFATMTLVKSVRSTPELGVPRTEKRLLARPGRGGGGYSLSLFSSVSVICMRRVLCPWKISTMFLIGRASSTRWCFAS